MDELGIAIVTALCSMLGGDDATLLFVGDAMMHDRQIQAARQSDGTYDYSDCFTEVTPLISEADYAVVNLETPLNGSRYSGYPVFNAPDSYAQALKDAGFDLFLTANNHTLDRKDHGLLRTINVLDSLGVDHIGTWADKKARQERLPFVKNVRGFKIGFLNYTYGTNGIEITGDVVVDYIDREQIRSDIKDARDQGAELICVAVHWGDEYKLLPVASQRKLGQWLLDEGVDMVIGGHPHVIEPMELDKEKHQLLVYSLGNFISGMRTTDTRGGAIVRAHLRRDEMGRAYVAAADYDLIFTEPASSKNDNYRLIYADSCASKGNEDNRRAFLNSARRVLDAHNINVPKRDND